MLDESDHLLLEKARTGDTHATQKLVERVQAQVYRFSLKMCRDPQDAEDVMQDTLLTLARGVKDFRGASSLSTWLYTIARSFCIKKRRKSKFAPKDQRSLDTQTHAESMQITDKAKRPDEALAAKQIEHALDQAIRSLEPRFREVLVLRDVEGLSAPEVAEILGESVQATKSRLHRARLMVRAQLAPLLMDPSLNAVDAGTCPDILTLFSKHVENEISAEICAQMEQHLQTCARCRGTCESLKATLALCGTSGRAIPVPASVQSSVKIALHNFLAENR